MLSARLMASTPTSIGDVHLTSFEVGTCAINNNYFCSPICERFKSLTNPICQTLFSSIPKVLPLLGVMSTYFIGNLGGHVSDCIGRSWRSLGGDLHNT